METMLVDRKQAARLLGISVALLGKLTAMKQIPHVRLGKIFRFDPIRIKEWLTDQQTTNTNFK